MLTSKKTIRRESDPNARRIVCRKGKRYLSDELNNLVPDLCNKILNLEKRKGEKVHIYILKFHDSNLRVARERLDPLLGAKRWKRKERKRIDIKIEGSGIIRLIMRVEYIRYGQFGGRADINNECVAERASACVKLA